MGLTITGGSSFRSKGYETAKHLEPPSSEPGEVISKEKFMELRKYAMKMCAENLKLRKEIEKLLKKETYHENFEDAFPGDQGLDEVSG